MNTVRSRFNYAADIYGEKNADGRYNVYHLLGTPTEYQMCIRDSPKGVQIGFKPSAFEPVVWDALPADEDWFHQQERAPKGS